MKRLTYFITLIAILGTLSFPEKESTFLVLLQFS